MTDSASRARVYAPWERTFERLTTPFEEFVHDETSSGLLLLGSTVLALALANGPLAEAYHHLLHLTLGVGVAGLRLEHDLHFWVNEGLMTLFFFVVGLEIKREVLVGELSVPRQAALPVIAAVGGMAVPALVFVAFNAGGPGIGGWAVPMATDIAFAVGVLVLLGRRVPPSLFTFLVALAIVDDLGAVLVIALFYTGELSLPALGVAALLLALLLAFNRAGVRRPSPYFVVGGLVWLAMLESGVHATVAGVLVAWTIPVRPKYDPLRFSEHVRELMEHFEHHTRAQPDLLRNEDARGSLQTLQDGVHAVQTPLQRLEHALHRPVALTIIPLFALANAGIPLGLEALGALLSAPVPAGVALGLVVGKFVGIAGVSLLAVRLGLGQLPAGCTPAHIVGVGLLGGIGFTMSIFIAELGFTQQPEVLVAAKTGVLAGSLVAGVAGYLWLRLRAPGSAG